MQWKGWPRRFNTWIPATDAANCPETKKNALYLSTGGKLFL